MKKTITTTAEASPPASYPMEGWETDPAGEFYVEPELRDVYSTSNPSEPELQSAKSHGFLRDYVLDDQTARERAASAGRSVAEVEAGHLALVDGEVVTYTWTQESGNVYTVRGTEFLEAADHLPAWLHQFRLGRARAARAAAERVVSVRAVGSCPCCGLFVGTDDLEPILDMGERGLRVRACSSCRPAIRLELYLSDDLTRTRTREYLATI